MGVTETVQDAVSGDNLWRHLEWFSQVRRDTGGLGEDAAADYIVSKLEEYGVPYQVHEFDAYLSYPRKASLEVISPESLSLGCVTHSFAQSTSAEGIISEIAHFQQADITSTTNKVALLDGLCTPITVLEGSKAGAKALIFANQGEVVHNMIATTIWGTPTPDQLDRLPQIPVVSISRPDGEKLKALLDKGPVTARIKTEVETGWYRSRLPEAIIEGYEQPEKFVLVGAHYCSWEVGVTDNATGDAVLLEMARILQQQKGQMKRSVRFCWWPGHSHGRYSGSTWYADQFFQDLNKNCIVYHNIDSPGVKGATMYVARHTTAEVEGFCKSIIFQLSGQDNPPVHRPSRAADQSFLANGVPAFSCYPFLPEGHPDRKPWTGGCANAYWWHSSEDTLDKADREIITLDTKMSATAILELCNADVLPLNFEAVALEITDYAAEFAEKATGHVDAQPFVTAAKDFAGAAHQLMLQMDKPLGSAGNKRLNDTLMKLSRQLVPLTYSKGGRFTHDPAEWSPIMRNTKNSTFSGLNQGLLLNELKGQELYGFAKAGVVRQLNRAVDILKEATKLCNETVSALLKQEGVGHP